MNALLLSLSLLAGSVQAEPAIDFSLRDLNNQELSLSSLKGQVVLLSFWATWCSPCMAEMPHLQKMHDDLGPQGFKVLSINVDDARNKSRVKPMIASKGYSFDVLLDTQTEVITKYNPQKALPYSVLIDKNGEIAWRHMGYDPGDEVELRQKIEGLLAAQ